MGSDKVKNSAGRHGRFSTRVLRARPLLPLPPSGVAQEGAALLPPAAGGGCAAPLASRVGFGWFLTVLCPGSPRGQRAGLSVVVFLIPALIRVAVTFWG